MAVKQFLSDETIFYTDDLDGSFDDKVLATANAVASGGGGGSASGMLLTITQSGDDYVLDKTYTEIKTAIESGILPFAVVEQDEGINDINIVRDYGYYQSKYFVDIINMNNTAMILTFLADTEDGVLTMYEG